MKQASIRALIIALMMFSPALVDAQSTLPVAAALADEQQVYVDQFVRSYERASTVTIPLAIIAGAWGLSRPNELSLFGGFLAAGVEYGMVLTGARSDPVSRSLVWAHVGAGLVGGALSYVGLERFQRRKLEERRRRQASLEVVPGMAADASTSVLIIVRF